jgi:flagellar biosynthesis protein FlhF
MHERVYTARTMAEALGQAKKELGRDARILRTRYLGGRGLLGWLRGGRDRWEVTASGNGEGLSPLAGEAGLVKGHYAAETPTVDVEPALDGREAREDRVTRRIGGRPASPTVGKQPAAVGEPLPPERERDVIRLALEELLDRSGLERTPDAAGPGDLAWLEPTLLAQDVDTGLVKDVLQRVRMDLTGRQLGRAKVVAGEARRILAETIKTVQPASGQRACGGARVVVLVGPTGVGKTTTLAKLAARAAVGAGQDVALVTMDTYRIAAEQQLRTYAEIINVPLRVVQSAGELHRAVRECSGRDVVLVDSAGRSPTHARQLEELTRWVDGAEPDETHLVLPANAGLASAKLALERFVGVGVDRVILTKLDEAASFGLAANVSYWHGLPISYVTMGQEVPDDLDLADAADLAGRILPVDQEERL